MTISTKSLTTAAAAAILLCAGGAARAGDDVRNFQPVLYAIYNHNGSAEVEACVSQVRAATKAGVKPGDLVKGWNNVDGAKLSGQDWMVPFGNVASYCGKKVLTPALCAAVVDAVDKHVFPEPYTPGDFERRASSFVPACRTSVEVAKDLGGELGFEVGGRTIRYAADMPGYLEKFAALQAEAEQAYHAASQAAVAPFRKLLKNDKWDLWSYYGPSDLARYNGPGGDELHTAEQHAKANVWFYVTYGDPGEGDRCAQQVWTVTRYQFDKQQKIAKKTEKKYCGEPPLKIYK
jgi:hypothetical protein